MVLGSNIQLISYERVVGPTIASTQLRTTSANEDNNFIEHECIQRDIKPIVLRFLCCYLHHCFK